MTSEDATAPAPIPKRVVVASKNPVKIDAAIKGFSAMFPQSIFTAHGVSVPSGVPDQPFSDEETLQGALNRAHNARELEPDADYWIGLEGGVMEDRELLQSFAWITVIGDGGRTGRARTAAYYLPEETAKLVRQGVELGPAEDQVWGQSNTKQKGGSVGLLTNNVIDRSGYYVQAVILALIPFRNAHLTFDGPAI
ncbi:hypothetical protein OQA88_12739 [Cercophora sp. LCS_1]